MLLDVLPLRVNSGAFFAGAIIGLLSQASVKTCINRWLRNRFYGGVNLSVSLSVTTGSDKCFHCVGLYISEADAQTHNIR